MTIWWPVNSFARDISEIFFKISQVLVLMSFCSSASAHKIRHSPLDLCASYCHYLNFRRFRCHFCPMTSRYVSMSFLQQSVRRYDGENSSSILYNESVICVHVLLQFCVRWHTSEPIVSANPTLFSIPEPSTCLKTSAVRTKIFYSSYKMVLSIEYFFLDYCSGFWTTSLCAIMPNFHSAAFFDIVPSSTSFLGSWAKFCSHPNSDF